MKLGKFTKPRGRMAVRRQISRSNIAATPINLGITKTIKQTETIKKYYKNVLEYKSENIYKQKRLLYMLVTAERLKKKKA